MPWGLCGRLSCNQRGNDGGLALLADLLASEVDYAVLADLLSAVLASDTDQRAGMCQAFTGEFLDEVLAAVDFVIAADGNAASNVILSKAVVAHRTEKLR
jgi:hypothetical protein